MPEYSISQLDKFEECALQYKFLYVDKIKRYAKEARLIWHLAAFDVEMRSARTPEALDVLKKELGELIDRIETESEFPPHESALCDWCPYWDLCPVKKHLVKVEALDPFALEKAVAEGKWGPEVLERLKACVVMEKRYTVTLKEEL